MPTATLRTSTPVEPDKAKRAIERILNALVLHRTDFGFQGDVPFGVLLTKPLDDDTLNDVQQFAHTFEEVPGVQEVSITHFRGRRTNGPLLAITIRFGRLER